MIKNSLSLLALCLVLLASGVGVFGAEVPSNAEIYRMLQELNSKLDSVTRENLKLQDRLEQAARELRETKRELANVKEARTAASPPPDTNPTPRRAKAEAETKSEDRESRWALGAELLLLSPFDTGHAFTVTRTLQSPAPANPLPSSLSTEEFSFDHGFSLSPRFWLGYETDSGAGLRGTFWYSEHDEDRTTFFDAATTSINASASAGSASTGAEGSGGVSASFDASARLASGAPAVPPGSGVRASQSLEFLTLDVELTKRIATARPIFDLSAGVRYARIDQAYSVHLLGTPLGPNVSTSLRHEHDFHGFGPTAALGISYPDVFIDGLTLNGRFRGALLFGDRDHQIAGSPLGTNNGFVRKDDTVGIVGLGLGIGYQLQNLPRDLEVEIGLGWEGQYWVNAYDANLDSGDIGLQGFLLSGHARW